jgi:hypothetical protein
MSSKNQRMLSFGTVAFFDAAKLFNTLAEQSTKRMKNTAFDTPFLDTCKSDWRITRRVLLLGERER